MLVTGLLASCFLSFVIVNVSAAPEPTPFPIVAASTQPLVTPTIVRKSPSRASQYRRNVISDLDGDVSSVLGNIGSNVPSYVASGIPQFFEDLPSGTAVQNSLDISDNELSSYPTAVLNFPPYGNWTDQGWNVRFHGNIYRQPNISLTKLDDLANGFLIDTSISELPPSQVAQARNVTSEIFVIQDAHAPAPVFSLLPASNAGASGEQGGGGATTASGGNQTVKFPYNATVEGDFDAFVTIQSNGLTAGNNTKTIQRLNVYTNGSADGNATAYLVPPEGITVVSDIDDILRITKIWSPKEIIDNTFARPYVPWMNMPEIYANWSRNLKLNGNDMTHFHYLTTLPEQVTPNYEQFIFSTYPGGSFDTRPLNFSDVSETLSVRKFLLDKIFQTFPQRKFVLVGDVSNSDIMKDYPAMVTQYPGQVQCIFLRNTTATDSTEDFPYDTSGFKNVNQQQYMFFVTPDDLMHLDIANGQCYNKSIPQNLTFGYQNLPLGLGSSAQASAGAHHGSSIASPQLRAYAGFTTLFGLLIAACFVVF